MATTTMDNTLAIGTKLVEFCRAGENMAAIDALYSDDIVSVEPIAGPEFEQSMTGITKVKGKNQWWAENNELHESKIDGPYPHGDRFILVMRYDVTPKSGPMAGNRFTMQETGLYTVKNGKITKEEFFYSMDG